MTSSQPDYPQRLHFQTRSHSQILGVRTWTQIFFFFHVSRQEHNSTQNSNNKILKDKAFSKCFYFSCNSSHILNTSSYIKQNQPEKCTLYILYQQIQGEKKMTRAGRQKPQSLDALLNP